MSELVIDSKDTVSGGTKPTSRESPYQCRIPPELITKVLDYLTHDQSLGTLAKLQSTSSAIYTLVNPYLYRHIIVNQVQALTLFDLFRGFPRDDNRLFLETNVPPNTHLLDLHIVYRLRSFFSHTRELSIMIHANEELDREFKEECQERLERYKEIVIGLSAFSGPTLWPTLQQCTIDLDPSPGRAQVTKHEGFGLYPDEYAPLFEAVPANLHPSKMVVTLPSALVTEGYEGHHLYWTRCLNDLKAEHTELYVVQDEFRIIPRSTTTFSIRFRPWENYWDGVETRLNAFLWRHHRRFRDVHTLKIIGILPKSGHHEGLTEAQVFKLMKPDVKLWMENRLAHGNSDPVRIAILADPSPEGEAAAIWRTHKQPKVKQEAG